MKKIVVAVLLALSLAAVVHAEESGKESTDAPKAAPQSQKDECILNSKDCGDQALSIQTKIDRLKQEIEKGTRVYTPQEIQKLKNRLKAAEDVLDELLFHPTNY
ncbi:hypothetical protein [Geomesophilobacter sediminis]|uniref:Uncharacterized protein n=1 Tax=Geomesophilobacter sediminis TaxID=2798584 RepID=A0A8J7JEB1_9BACT|nr:hypothetical protein [Geomesophilobacter sediminis]MBJ6724329.1 hypothetical protein [Geomesophilobacter sediminis]